jgi:hypothetical protein
MSFIHELSRVVARLRVVYVITAVRASKTTQ